jgi:hypothetical protein
MRSASLVLSVACACPASEITGSNEYDDRHHHDIGKNCRPYRHYATDPYDEAYNTTCWL